MVVAAATMLVCAAASHADVKPGDVITRDNVAAAADLLPPSVQLMLKHGMKITVVPYEQCPLPRAFLDATEKYAAQVKLAEEGRRIDNYVAGMPFPNLAVTDPLAAWKIMWNHEYKPAYSDDVYTSWLVENQD